jgi:uncharacterized protein (DUF488 family)
MTTTAIFTIGHSNRDVNSLLQLLVDNSIQVVVDVRSAPYSRYVPQFNKKEIQAAIVDRGIKYIFMGDSIGGKPAAPHYSDQNGKVDYAKLAESELFQQGLNRLIKGVQDGWLIALMCAEEDPFKCHRHLLIANELELKRNVPVWHIRSDGSTIRSRKYLQEYHGQLRLF